MAETRYIFVNQPDVAWSITVPRGMKIPVTCELVGGGGGGGGYDAGTQGGNGAGGQYTKSVFTVSGGDVLTFIVGGGGGAGASSRGNAAGGAAGTSMVNYIYSVFNLKTATGAARTYPKTNSVWDQFMNQNAVWESDNNALTFVRTYNVTIPVTGYYQYKFNASADARLYVDGGLKAGSTNYAKEYVASEIITAGVHTFRIEATKINSTDPGNAIPSVAFELTQSPTGFSNGFTDKFTGSMSGGRGGNAGTAGSSGGGGGGGGASVLLINGIVAAIAGGGGGGGGAGVGSAGHDATNSPDTRSDYYNGQSGQPKRGDGGGGGASGGGLHAGSGGTEVGGDSGGNAGESADCWYPDDPYGQNQINYATGRNAFATLDYGTGGSPGQAGKAGYVRFSFETTFASYKVGNQWKDVESVYIKDAGVWKEAVPYIKKNGEWQALARREIGRYQAGAGIVGTDYRDLAMRPVPVYVYIGGGGESNWSYSGGYGGTVVDASGNAIRTPVSGGSLSFGGGGDQANDT